MGVTRRNISPGLAIRAIEPMQEFIVHPFAGLVATDGVQYSPVVTFGTVVATLAAFFLDPGFDMRIQELEVALTQRMTEKGNVQGSLHYYWLARRNAQGTLGEYVGISPTLSKGVGSLLNSEDTISGFIPVGSLPDAPIDLVMMGACRIASGMTAEMKSVSFVRLVGAVIPGV